MTEQEAIFQLKQCDVEYVFTQEQKEAYKIALQALEDQDKRRWILVSEKLPEPKSKTYGNKQQRTEVIACLKNGVVKEMMFEFATNEFWEAGDDCPILHSHTDYYGEDCQVIAWMPLPKPYKKEVEE